MSCVCVSESWGSVCVSGWHLCVCVCSCVPICVHLPATPTPLNPLPDLASQGPQGSMLDLTHHHAGSDSVQASLHPSGCRHTALRAQRLCPGVQAGWTPQVLGGPLPETWTGGGVQASRSQSVSCQLPKITCPLPSSALTLGWSPAGRRQDMACPHTGSCRGC